MNEINPEKNNENNQINLSLNNISLKSTPFGNNTSLSNEILYFSINQDSK